MKRIKELIPYIIVIIVALLIKTYIGTPVRVNGESMSKTLFDKDIMILDKISYRFKEIERFDIIVIRYENEYLIKRVIGLPNDVIQYKNNNLYVNGERIEEDFYHELTNDFSLSDIGLKKIAKDNYFVLGDNRLNSLDSRYLGTFNIEDIEGHAIFTIFPFSRFGVKK